MTMSLRRQILAAMQYEAGTGPIPRRIAMTHGIESEALKDTSKPVAEAPRSPNSPAHPVTREPAAFDPNDPNPPAPPSPRPANQTDSGFGSFG
ncbi:fibronectin-attachment protein (FAP) [Methylobacterium sp. J-088]|uniref:fibronectin-attachment protein (FAP) n=1 Tax=unclassified Methylobacterium TaxID=2615210 RepID=UPI001FBA8215|nr:MULTISPECIES: fibronectin-attachment protein (FAP) [unclassified Methylobacterium]MCJ2064243.1 fibronectin-attachment protein (FAP) [Methylobacterium sp. J-088]